jgi:sarcosine oxidase
VILASPCSGHGFKFASVIGEVLADLTCDGQTPLPSEMFRLGRFSKA